MYIYIYIATTTETHALKTGCSFTCVGTDLFQVLFSCGSFGAEGCSPTAVPNH